MKLKVLAPLDPGFMPMAVVYRDFEAAVKAEGGEPLAIGLERNDGLTSVFTIEVFKDGTGLNGYYDICVTMDSPTAMITDIVAQFVRRY